MVKKKLCLNAHFVGQEMQWDTFQPWNNIIVLMIIMFIYRGHNMIIKMLYALYTITVQSYFTQNPTFRNSPENCQKLCYIYIINKSWELNAYSNKCVFNLFLKTSTLQLRFTDGSNWLHNIGPVTEKALVPYFFIE